MNFELALGVEAPAKLTEKSLTKGKKNYYHRWEHSN